MSKHDSWSSRRRSVILPVAYTAGLFALSSIPGATGPDAAPSTRWIAWVPPHLQNLLHIPLYGMLAWLWCSTLEAWSKTTPFRILAAISFSALYALFDEWYQLSVPGRTGSLTDVTLNLTGVAAGVLLFKRSRRRNGPG